MQFGQGGSGGMELVEIQYSKPSGFLTAGAMPPPELAPQFGASPLGEQFDSDGSIALGTV